MLEGDLQLYGVERLFNSQQFENLELAQPAKNGHCQLLTACTRSARYRHDPGLWSFGSFRKDKQAAEGDFTGACVGEINRT
jgi:hypothetical protein